MNLPSPFRARLQVTLGCVGAVAIWWWRGGAVTAVVAGIAGVLALVAWLAPTRFAPIQRSIDRGLHFVLVVLTWILLGFVYFLIFTPFRFATGRGRSNQRYWRQRPETESFLQSCRSSLSRFDRQY